MSEDWGHGPNEPVHTYTEAEIRYAMTQVMHTMADEQKTELVIQRLRGNRRGGSSEEA